jgi:hypothetical protein
LIINILKNYFKDKILRGIANQAEFEALALDIFQYQYKYNAFYQRYCSLIGTDSSKIFDIKDIPFLPISFFKNQKLKTKNWRHQFRYYEYANK